MATVLQWRRVNHVDWLLVLGAAIVCSGALLCATSVNTGHPIAGVFFGAFGVSGIVAIVFDRRRLRQRIDDLATMKIQIEPESLQLGESFRCSISLAPKHNFTLCEWSVSLVCVDTEGMGGRKGSHSKKWIQSSFTCCRKQLIRAGEPAHLTATLVPPVEAQQIFGGDPKKNHCELQVRIRSGLLSALFSVAVIDVNLNEEKNNDKSWLQ